MDQEIVDAIHQQKSALCLFFDDENAFYQKHCNELAGRIIREKRILEFETPNRVKVTYEYDIKAAKEDVGEKDIVFLFLPNKRKSWLKIYINGKRLAIPKSDRIKDHLYTIVQKNVEDLKSNLNSEKSANELWDEIWNDKKPIPCFIYRESLPANFSSGIIEIEFYDFLDIDKDHKNNRCSLFDEKHYQYNYPLVAQGNSWLYVKSPSRFDIDVNYDKTNVEKNEENDPEISSYTIKRNEGEESFKITVKVPKTLRLWYASLVWLGVIFILLFFVAFVSAICKGLTKHEFSPVYAQVGISIIAAVIATRGWLMNEETVLKKVSKWLTWIVIIIVFLLIGAYSFFMLK
jgi:hypothetical protein